MKVKSWYNNRIAVWPVEVSCEAMRESLQCKNVFEQVTSATNPSVCQTPASSAAFSSALKLRGLGFLDTFEEQHGTCVVDPHGKGFGRPVLVILQGASQ